MPESETPNKTKNKPSKKRRGGIFRWLIFLLITITVGGGLYFIDSNIKSKNRINNLMQAQENQITLITINQTDLTNNINNLTAQLTRVQNQLNTNKTDWSIIQAKRLINLAAISITYQHDAQTTIDLLRAANDELKKANPLAQTELQKKIAGNIAELVSFKTPDINGVYLQLKNINQQIDQIVIAPACGTEKTTAETTTSASKWKTFWLHMKGGLRHVLNIQHHQNDMPSLFSMKNQELFKGYLHLLTAQMQTALLQNNKIIFNAAIDQFNTALTLCSGLKQESILPIKNAISPLENIDWVQAWPNLDELVTLANNL